MSESTDRQVGKSTERPGVRRILEPVAMGLMALGAVMMFQPFARALYSFSFPVILVGTLTFIVVSHLSE